LAFAFPLAFALAFAFASAAFAPPWPKNVKGYEHQKKWISQPSHQLAGQSGPSAGGLGGSRNPLEQLLAMAGMKSKQQSYLLEKNQNKALNNVNKNFDQRCPEASTLTLASSFILFLSRRTRSCKTVHQ